METKAFCPAGPLPIQSNQTHTLPSILIPAVHLASVYGPARSSFSSWPVQTIGSAATPWTACSRRSRPSVEFRDIFLRSC